MAPVDRSKPFQVGIVGLGSISTFYINAIANNTTDFVLKAVCDLRKPADMSKFGSARYFSDFMDMIDNGGVDTVFITTPPNTHIDIIEYAASKKKNILVEKPIGITIEECKRATSTASKNDTHLYFAYHSAFAPAALRVKDMIVEHTSKGENITKFDITFKEDVRRYHTHGDAWVFNSRLSGGGCLIDSGINAISSVEDVLGKITPTRASLSTADPYTVETTAEVDFIVEGNDTISGHLSQDWLWTEAEVRKFTYWLTSGKKLEFNMVDETVTYELDGDSAVFNITSRKNLDGNLTPMAAEYENLVKDAAKLFRDNTRNFNKLATGPFLTVTECYKKAKQ